MKKSRNKIRDWLIALAITTVMSSVAHGATVVGSLVAWGNDENGLGDIPTGNNFVDVAAGVYHSLALKSDGSIVAWGKHSEGQCNVPAGIRCKGISAGFYHSLALKSDGSLVAWGNNDHGQCNVPPVNNFKAISTGGWHNLALKSDGSLVSWGRNEEGQCNVPSGNSFVAIAAGWYHSLALRSDGSLDAWGNNAHGQLGSSSEHDWQNHINGSFKDITAGKFHSLALKSDGSLVAWGDNFRGQRSVPPGNSFTVIVAGESHNLAVKSDGSLVSWGDNSCNQHNVPTGNNFIAIAAGGSHNIAIRTPTPPYLSAKVPPTLEKDKPYSVEVSRESGSYITEGGAVGFGWKNCRLTVERNQVSGSVDLKVWNDKRTPITQIYVTIGRKVCSCLFNRVPRSSSKEQYAPMTFSFGVNYPSQDASYDINLIQTQTMDEELGKKHIEVENGGWVAKLGELKTHSSKETIHADRKEGLLDDAICDQILTLIPSHAAFKKYNTYRYEIVSVDRIYDHLQRVDMSSLKISAIVMAKKINNATGEQQLMCYGLFFEIPHVDSRTIIRALDWSYLFYTEDKTDKEQYEKYIEEEDARKDIRILYPKALRQPGLSLLPGKTRNEVIHNDAKNV
jgi:hypothetical protein